MWTLIIIIVVDILIKFIYDMGQQKTQVLKQGGMRIKYSVLIDHIMQGHNQVRVIRQTEDSIDLGVANHGGSTGFFLTQTFGSLTVQWKVDSPYFGRHELKWQFPEFLDQEKMLERINNDLEKYQTNVMKAQGY